MVEQTISGNNAIGVQISGDGNSVTIVAGGSVLALDRLQARGSASIPRNERQLLLTETRMTALVGRAKELDEIATWLRLQAPAKVRCVVGSMGSGKTRLAIEACEAAEATGWVAGFLSGEELARLHDTRGLASWHPPQDILVVIDDAAAVAAILKTWLDTIARSVPSSGASRLRILLIERSADGDYGWWADLHRVESFARAGAADLLGDDPPVELAPIAAIDDRRALLADAMRLAAAIHGAPPPSPPATGADPDFDRRLAADRLETTPLFLMMAAVVAVETGAPAALALGRSDLASKMAQVERLRLARFGQSRGLPANGDLVAHLCACVTVQQGCTLANAIELVRTERVAMAFNTALTDAAIVDILADVLPGAAHGGLDRVRPDILASAFTHREILGPRTRSSAERFAIIQRCAKRDRKSVISSLVHMAQDNAGDAADLSAIDWLGALADDSDDVGELVELLEGLPDRTLALRELAAAVNQRLVEVVNAAPHGTANAEALLAHLLSTLGNRLANIGRVEESLDAYKASVNLYRHLDAASGEDFVAELAMALTNLGLGLSAAGDAWGAVAAAQEAVALRRVLLERSDTSPADLAMALSNLGNHLSDAEDGTAALTANRESVDLYQALAKVHPDFFAPNLAMALISLGDRLAETGALPEAIAASERAVAMCRNLAAANPDAFLQDLALALNNLGVRLSKAGEADRAFAATSEAVRHYRTLMRRPSDPHREQLAGALENLASRLEHAGRIGAALAVSEEALREYRILAEARPDRFAPYLVAVLATVGDLLERESRIGDAAVADHEALTLLCPFFLEEPDGLAELVAERLHGYVRRARVSNTSIDEALVDAIQATLQTISGKTADD